jgi:hypothetical protein
VLKDGGYYGQLDDEIVGRLVKVAQSVGFPVVVTSGWMSNHPKPRHKQRGVIDLRVIGLSREEEGQLGAALARRFEVVNRLGPPAFDPHYHVQALHDRREFPASGSHPPRVEFFLGAFWK